jgi:hypothetical protein
VTEIETPRTRKWHLGQEWNSNAVRSYKEVANRREKTMKDADRVLAKWRGRGYGSLFKEGQGN